MPSWIVTSHSGQLSLIPSVGIVAKEQWQCSVAGKVTLDLVSHRLCITYVVMYIHCVFKKGATIFCPLTLPKVD